MSADAMKREGDRHAQLTASLRAVRQRIDDACREAGRDPDGVTLVAVTKFFPAADAAVLVDLGVTDIGESRDQEARPKIAELAGLLAPARATDRSGPPGAQSGTCAAGLPRVHFIGQLQSNKAAAVAGYADVVESVDRAKVVGALNRGACAANRHLEVLIQVSLDADCRRGGVAADGLADLADRVVRAERLRLAGLMAVAPLGADPDTAFARLADLSADLRRDHPEATMMSAGMTADLEQAIRHGATHVRVGSAILGARPEGR